MGLFFYKKISIQTKHTPDGIQRIFSDVSNNLGKNEEIGKLLSNNWYVRINSGGSRFQIAIGRNAPRFARSGIHSALKGKIKENNGTQGTNISMIVRPSDEYVFILGLVFLFITAVLFYSIINHLMPPLIMSSILLFAWYTAFLIDFNLHVKTYRRVINSCFN